jgi:hypothetical protein
MNKKQEGVGEQPPTLTALVSGEGDIEGQM